jgi:hypothetical protein
MRVLLQNFVLAVFIGDLVPVVHRLASAVASRAVARLLLVKRRDKATLIQIKPPHEFGGGSAMSYGFERLSPMWPVLI